MFGEKAPVCLAAQKSNVAGWIWYATSTALAAAEALRRQQCADRRVGGRGKHCDGNDAQPGRFSHGRRGRDVR
jgi:hypothetical protein